MLIKRLIATIIYGIFLTGIGIGLSRIYLTLFDPNYMLFILNTAPFYLMDTTVAKVVSFFLGLLFSGVNIQLILHFYDFEKKWVNE